MLLKPSRNFKISKKKWYARTRPREARLHLSNLNATSPYPN